MISLQRRFYQKYPLYTSTPFLALLEHISVGQELDGDVYKQHIRENFSENRATLARVYNISDSEVSLEVFNPYTYKVSTIVIKKDNVRVDSKHFILRGDLPENEQYAEIIVIPQPFSSFNCYR